MKKKKSSKKTVVKKAKKKAVRKPARKAVKKTVKKAAKRVTKKASPSKSSRSPQYSGVAVGSQVPDFTVTSSTGSQFKFSDLKGKKVVLYFYPKDDTPGCTIEGNDFNRYLADFKELNTIVYGISRDSVASHCKFIGKFGFRFELLSDDKEIMCKLFDVIQEKNMYGKIMMGIERSTFVIDENQALIAEYRKVKAEGHAEAILNYIRSLT